MKKILITGTSKGIGKVIFEHFKNLGYEVFGAGRSEVCDKNYFQIDLNKENAPEELYQKALDAMGGVDILINNAGTYVTCKTENMQSEDISSMINLNFTVPYKLITKAIPYMKERNWGRIINIGSISGSVGEGYASLYSGTKAGLIGLTKSLGLELAEYGITVNTINPGWVETELAENACREGEFSKEENLQIIPQKRFIEPIEIAKLCEYLVSDDAKGLTGQSINLCAGLSIG